MMNWMLSKSVKEPGDARLSFFDLASLGFTLIASILSAIWLWRFVSDYPDPSGANGYFYMKQTETLSSGLGFYFKDYSLAFAIPVAFMRLFHDSLEAFRASTVFVWIGLVWGVAWLTFNLSRELRPTSKMIAVMASVAAVCCCTQLYEFTLTFFKNSCAMMLILWGAGFALSASYLAIPIFIAALLTHKSVSVVFLLLLLARAVQVAQLKDRRQLWLVGGIGALTGIVFLCFFDRASAHIRAMFADFHGPHLWWMWIRRLPQSNLELFLTISGLLIAALVGLATRSRFNRAQRVYIDAMIMLSLLALQPFQIPGPNGPFYRFILLAPALSIPLIMSGISRVRLGSMIGIVGLLPFLVQPALSTHEVDEVFTPWAVIRDDVLEIKKFVRPEDHLTSHHGFEFFIDYTTGIRSRSFLSDHPEQKDFRVAYAPDFWVRNEAASVDLREHALLSIGSEYLLVTEVDWQALRKKWSLRDHWKNPETHRPDFISE